MPILQILKKITTQFVKIFYPANIAITLIKGYKLLISPYIGIRCRFYPSCSSYAIEAYELKGFIKGTLLTLLRLIRCNPFSKGGYDPVPGSIKLKISKDF